MSHAKKPLLMPNAWGERIDASKPTYASDGNICGAWRKVRLRTGKRGAVKLGGSWWVHEKLYEHVGRWVWCEVTEYWHVATDVWHNRPGMRDKDFMQDFICKCQN